jgi:uncharacterized damage-inducible protein DinB
MKTHILAAVLVIAASSQAAEQPTAPAKPPATFSAEFLSNLTDVESKLVKLSEAIPAEKYTWRPSADVRSISEVFMHVAGSNYVLLTFLGVKAPADMPEDIERITDKQRVVAELKRSFEHVRKTATVMREADLSKPVSLFGNPTTNRGVYVTVLNHLHEHLGQSIAYARMNGVKPPWSD